MLLKTWDLTKYFGGLAAISRVQIQVEEGEILGLIGPNGAGKTTLFNLITGFERPSGGSILFQGEEISGLRPHRITRKGIARTFQVVKPFPHLSVLGNVQVAAFCHLRSPAQAREKAGESVTFVGLAHKRDVPASDLTLGEQKRLEIARALATRPRLLLLDEPMGGLTQTEVEEALGLIRRIREQGITVVLVEHVMRAVMELSHRIVVIHHGEKIAEGSPATVAGNPAVVSAYLGKGHAHD